MSSARVLQQSPNWDKYCDHKEGKIGDYFREGWPQCGPFNVIWFELILWDGTREKATVDFSMQYRAEGKNWISFGGRTIYKHQVVAWRELKKQ